MGIQMEISPEQVLAEIEMLKSEFRAKQEILLETLDDLLPGVEKSYRYKLCRVISYNLHLVLSSEQSKGSLGNFAALSKKILKLKKAAEKDDVLVAFATGKREAEKELAELSEPEFAMESLHVKTPFVTTTPKEIPNVADKSDNGKGQSS